MDRHIDDDGTWRERHAMAIGAAGLALLAGLGIWQVFALLGKALALPF